MRGGISLPFLTLVLDGGKWVPGCWIQHVNQKRIIIIVVIILFHCCEELIIVSLCYICQI
jgi:hypothetical protein